MTRAKKITLFLGLTYCSSSGKTLTKLLYLFYSIILNKYFKRSKKKLFAILCRTGAAIPPYDYTGFVATIEFIDDVSTQSASTAATLEVSPYPSIAVQSKNKNDIKSLRHNINSVLFWWCFFFSQETWETTNPVRWQSNQPI